MTLLELSFIKGSASLSNGVAISGQVLPLRADQ